MSRNTEALREHKLFWLSIYIKTHILWGSVTSQSKLKIKHLVWEWMYFQPELIGGILSIPAPTVHLVASEEQGGRRETFLVNEWLFPLTKITQTHARELAIWSNFITKAKILIITDNCRTTGVTKHRKRHLQRGKQPSSNVKQEEAMNEVLPSASSMTSLLWP